MNLIQSLWLHNVALLNVLAIKCFKQETCSTRYYFIKRAEEKSTPHCRCTVVRENQETYTIFSNSNEESGSITDVHLSEQYTNGSFIIDVDEFGQVVVLE